MSMNRYLQQQATVEPAVRDEKGNIVLDAYGKPVKGSPYVAAVRSEEQLEEIQSSSWMREKGAKIVSLVQYFTTDNIDAGDYIDGRLVIFKEVYRDGSGRDIGRRCLT